MTSVTEMSRTHTSGVRRRLRFALLFLALAAAALHPGTRAAQAAQASLSWVAPTTYTDGKPITSMGGYKVYLGTTSGNYSQNINVGNVTSYTVTSLNDAATYYFAVSAYDSAGVVSGLSSQVALTTPAAPPPATLYTLSASAGTGGSITPTGSVVLSKGTSQTFTITPASGYKVAAVTVDGASVGTPSSYTFSNVAGNHTIGASFVSTTTGNTVSAGTWFNQAIASQNGSFTAHFDVTPSAANVDAVTGFSASSSNAFTSIAACVRFNSTGTIDARNGSTYAAKTAVPYAAGKSYHVRMVVNVPGHSYDVYVTPAGGTETMVAQGYTFRTEQASVTALANLAAYVTTGSAQLQNVSVAANAAAPTLNAATGAWLNQPIAKQTGAFTAQFDMVASAAKIDSATGLSAGAAKAFTDLAAGVRFNSTGTIDARNGGAYAARVAVPYTAGTVYRVRMVVNVPTRRYDVYVTPAGGTEVLLAQGYAFRTEQAAVTSLANLGIFATTGSEQVRNLTVTP